MQFYRLKDLREDAEKKQSTIAELLNITQQQYSLYETGKREIPFSMCLILADYYKVSLDYVAGRTNDKRGIGFKIQEKKKSITKPNNDSGQYNITQTNSSGLNNISIKGK